MSCRREFAALAGVFPVHIEDGCHKTAQSESNRSAPESIQVIDVIHPFPRRGVAVNVLALAFGLLYTLLSAASGVIGVFGDRALVWVVTTALFAVVFYAIRQYLLLDSISLPRARIPRDSRVGIPLTRFRPRTGRLSRHDLREVSRSKINPETVVRLHTRRRSSESREHSCLERNCGPEFSNRKAAAMGCFKSSTSRAGLGKVLGFTPGEAKKRRLDRRSYMAVPVVDQDGRSKAVIYLDSKKLSVFSLELAEAMGKVGFLSEGSHASSREGNAGWSRQADSRKRSCPERCAMLVHEGRGA